AGAFDPTGERSVRGALGEGSRNVARLAETLFTDFLFPFEVTSLLLVVAVVGGIVLARRSTGSGDLGEVHRQEPSRRRSATASGREPGDATEGRR
ncbi:MAG: NADH-quinone oxidoreductase subunit J, partial [Acidimicrobiia bacterium]